MGCSNSKVDNEEGVARCKQRKRLMNQTVASRHNLAASHAMFVISLKGVGSAFRTFAEGEVKDVDSQTLYSTEMPNTPRTPPLKLNPPSVLPPEPPMTSGKVPSFSPSPPPHSPLSPHVRLSALRLQTGSPIIRAVSSPESVTMDFLPPPPPPPITFSKEYRMEHTPPIIPTKIHSFEETPNSYMKTYRIEDSPPPPPLIQPIQTDGDWRYFDRTPPLFNGVRDNNPPPPPPPPVIRSSWQDLFMDPFRPSPPSYNYMEERRNLDAEEHRRRHEPEQRRIHEAEHRKILEAEQRNAREAEQRRKHEFEQRRIYEEQMRARDMEERRTRELEQKRLKEMEQRRPPPPVKIMEVKPVSEAKLKNLEHEVPALEDDDIPELEDVEDDFDIDGPPPQDLHVEKDNKVVNQPEPEPAPAPAPAPAPEPEPEPVTKIKPEPVTEIKLEPVIEIKPEPVTEIKPEPVPETKPELEIKLESEIKPVAEPVTPPKTPPQTPPKVQEPSPKVVKTVKTPSPGKPPGKPPKPEAILKTNKQIAVAIAERGGRDLIHILRDVDECFFKAAECGENVSRILETKKAHYHSTFSDNWKGVGESARMSFRKLSGRAGSGSFRSTSFRTSSNMSNMSNMSVLTDDSASIMSMRRSISNLSSQRFTEECGLINSHAATLDRLFAWEKKLYKEVKDAEALRIELEKKFSLFRHQDHKNEDQTIVDKTRFSIKALQTRMVVAIEAVDNGARQVQKLRDEELYPQLLELLDGMGAMWKEMSVCHQAQLRAVEAIRSLDNSAAYEPTTSSHRQSTTQLELALNKWSEGLHRVVRSQRDYMKNLTSWLRLSLMQFSDEVDAGSRNGSRSPSRSPRSPQFSMGLNASPIYGLCQQWKELLDQVADTVTLEAIGSFANVVKELLSLQWEELRIKKRVENYERELERREQALHSASMRDPGSAPPGPPSKSPTTTSGSDLDDRAFDVVVSQGFPERTEVAERRLKYEVSRRKLEVEREALRKATTDTRAYTLNSLQAGLPQLFQAVIAFANLEAEVYDKLNSSALLNK